MRRRLLWLLLTTLGVWLAFPLGFAAGFAVSLLVVAPIALVAPQLGGAETIFAVGVPIGALTGGVLVGALQSPLVRDRPDWLRRSAIGGVFVLPASLAALYTSPFPPAAPACEAWTSAAALAAFGGGLAYGMITARQAVREIPDVVNGRARRS